MKKGCYPLKHVAHCESAKKPADHKTDPELIPRAPNILVSQAPLFVFLRILIGAAGGFVFSFIIQALMYFIK